MNDTRQKQPLTVGIQIMLLMSEAIWIPWAINGGFWKLVSLGSPDPMFATAHHKLTPPFASLTFARAREPRDGHKTLC